MTILEASLIRKLSSETTQSDTASYIASLQRYVETIIGKHGDGDAADHCGISYDRLEVKRWNENSVLVYSIDGECGSGVLRADYMCYAIFLSARESKAIQANMKTKVMRVFENARWTDIQTIEGILDLSASGRRWEGGIKDGKPFGYGTAFDEEGKREYEGFMYNGVKTCFGKEFYSGMERVKYDSCFWNDKKWGKGTLFDRCGVIEYDGLWKNDNQYSPDGDSDTIDDHTKSMKVIKGSHNEVGSFILSSWLFSLRRIVIGDECLKDVWVFELDGLGELKSVVIGEKCCTYTKSIDDLFPHERGESVYRIVNCPKLVSIIVDPFSFAEYDSFELRNLPSLYSIVVFDYCFLFH